MPINPLNTGNINKDQDKNKKNQITTGSPVDISGVSPGAAQGQAAASSDQNSSGSFTNLNQYIDANKDQGAGLGGKIEQNVQNVANKGLNELGQSQQEYNRSTEASGVNPNDYSLDKANAIARKAYNSPHLISNEEIEGANQARQKTAAFAAGSDTGPKTLNELNSYQVATNTLQGAKDKVGLTDTESGRETLLRETYQKPDYSKGQSGLDQLLTQNVSQNKERFQNLRNSLLNEQGLDGQRAKAIQAASDKRNQVIQGTSEANKNVNQALWGTPDQEQKGGVLGGYEQSLLSRPDQYKAQLQTNIDAAKKAALNTIKSRNGQTWGLSSDQMLQMALKSGNQPDQATLQNTVSQQDLLRMQALNKLAGRDPNLIGANALTSVDKKQFNPSDVKVDFAPVQKLMEQKAGAYVRDVQSIASKGVNMSIPDVYGKTIKGFAGINDAVNRVNIKMNDPALDVRENQKIVNSLQSQIAEINKTRNANGMKSIGIDFALIRAEDKKIWDKMRGQLPPRWDKDQWITSRKNEPKHKEFRKAVEIAAIVVATYKTLEMFNNNPMLQTHSTQMKGNAGFSPVQTLDTSAWELAPGSAPAAPGGKKVSPGQVTYETPQTPTRPTPAPAPAAPPRTRMF